MYVAIFEWGNSPPGSVQSEVPSGFRVPVQEAGGSHDQEDLCPITSCAPTIPIPRSEGMVTVPHISVISYLDHCDLLCTPEEHLEFSAGPECKSQTMQERSTAHVVLDL